MVERCVFVFSIFRPSNRATFVWIAASSVGTCERTFVWIAASSVGTREPTSVWMPMDKSCRLRPPSPVQSSPFLLSLVSCVCLPCCACSCVLHVFRPCFRFCLSSFGRLGSPNLLADPRGDPLLLWVQTTSLTRYTM